ncbi:MAG: hypothetical protein ED557_01195 [Balneola sp.]|nr:MAG: hypothetical protein ED557_01195 [Balneola sp.]
MFELVQHPQHQPSILEFENGSIQVLLAVDDQGFGLQEIQRVDAVLVQTANSSNAKEILRSIRIQKNRQLALTPVFISSSVPGCRKIEFLFDGTYSTDTESLMLQKIKHIRAQLRSFTFDVHQLDYNHSLLQAALQYSHSRGCTLKPMRERNSKIGYSYPFLGSIIRDDESQKVVELMEQSIKEGYFAKKSLDKVHTCKKCSGGYLNYRECCPKCGSSDLQTDDLIHHFVCAHIAPESDFKTDNDTMECPKCSKELRHIGIDYDKPSSMHTCNNCSHQFQQPEIKALCIDCGCDNQLKQLGNIEISEYAITPMGEYAAINGMHVKSKKAEKKGSKTVSEQIFELFKSQEIQRIAKSGHQSWEGSLRVNLDFMTAFHPEQQELIQSEICGIISNYLDSVDVLSSPTTSWFRFMLVDYSKERAAEIGEIIQRNIEKLLADGPGKDQSVVETLITSLGEEG